MIVSLGLNVPFSLVILDDGSTTENGKTQNLKDLQLTKVYNVQIMIHEVDKLKGGQSKIRCCTYLPWKDKYISVYTFVKNSKDVLHFPHKEVIAISV